MTALSYEVVDVFTDTAYEGNPLAVVLDADELTAAQMQSMAREFHLSETAFVLAPPPGADYRVRIFTPEVEVPFAGHPTVGTAWVLARLGRVPIGAVVQDCPAGRKTVAVDAEGAEVDGGRPSVGEPLDPAPLVAAVGLSSSDVSGGPPPRVSGTGLPWAFLPVRREALARVVPDGNGLRGLLDVAAGVSVSAWDPSTATAHARVLTADLASWEDPATGSAALGYGGWLVASGLLPGEGSSSYTVVQGVEMGRPSRLAGRVDASGGAATSSRVRGGVVPVARGTITAP